jgi:cold shock protein
MATILASVLELTVLSMLAAACCVAASSLQVENFPVLFATLSLLAAITALWRCLMTESVRPRCLGRPEMTMPTGTVKWFNPTKGYGFIQPQGGGKDVFVHISAVERAGLSTLNEGQTVQYEMVSNRGKESAENLKVK